MANPAGEQPALESKREIAETIKDQAKKQQDVADVAASAIVVATDALDRVTFEENGKNAFQLLMERAQDPQKAFQVLKSIISPQAKDPDLLNDEYLKNLDPKAVYGDVVNLPDIDFLKTQLISTALGTLRANPTALTEGKRAMIEKLVNTKNGNGPLEERFPSDVKKGQVSYLNLNEKTFDKDKSVDKKFAKLQKMLDSTKAFQDKYGVSVADVFGMDVMENSQVVNKVEAVRAVERLQQAFIDMKLELPDAKAMKKDGDFGKTTAKYLEYALKNNKEDLLIALGRPTPQVQVAQNDTYDLRHPLE